MILAIMAISTAFNLMIIKWKLTHERYADGALDAALLVVLSLVFGGTMGGMMIATASSALISLYLLADPLKLDFL